MTQVDILLTGGLVVTMNERYDIFANGAVAIRHNEIIAVGPATELNQAYTAAEVIDCQDQLVMPGLVNTHTHVPMTLLRGISDDLRLDVWLMGYMMPIEREFVSPEFCRLGTQLACAEMIRSGVTLFADMYYFEADIAEAVASAGMRALLGESVLKFPSPDADSYEESLVYTGNFIERYRNHPLINPTIAPHAPYTNTIDTLHACAKLAAEFDIPMMTHLAETRLEVEESRQQFDMPVIKRMKELGLFNGKVLAAHCVHIDQDEIRTLREHNVHVAHCPTANLKLASGIAPVAEMLERGVTVGIGTDGPASNNDLDMFEEMRLAAILAKGASYDPTALPAKQALTMATRNGAKTLFLDHITGSLEPGKRADLIVVNRSGLHNSPRFDHNPDAVYSQLVYATKSTDVAHVMCEGQWLMRDRKLLTIDEEAVRQAAEDYARRIEAFLVAREGNVLSKLVTIGGLEQEESFEIQVKARIESLDILQPLFDHKDVEIVRHTHYHQYDTYFLFNDESLGRVRYREDDAINADGEVSNVRTRLTYTMPTKESEFLNAILLSRSQFIAPATHPLRFYREYFQADQEFTFEKERRRWHILYKGVLFYINLDDLLGGQKRALFLEIKSRTWSSRDAEYKAELTSELMGILGISPQEAIRAEYLELAAEDQL